MSALTHGLFSSKFMLCDRCGSNAKCERFTPGNRCVLEQEAFDKIVSELVEEYDLDGVVDKISVERAAMYLIRINRAEAYEATVGTNEKSAYWGTYIGRMDSVLRGLFNDLAISRGKRMQLEKGDAMLVTLDEVMRKFARSQQSNQLLDKDTKMRRLVRSSVRSKLLTMWIKDYPKLESGLRREGARVAGKKRKLPRVAVVQLMEATERAKSKISSGETAEDILPILPKADG